MTTADDSSQAMLDRLFLQARTHNGWLDRPVPDELLRKMYETLRMAPTAANSQPMRVVFVKSAAAKEKLRPALSQGNVEKTMAAPATAIIAYDVQFYEHMPRLFKAYDMKTGLLAMPAEKRERMAFMNSSLQGAYLIIVARALGLDVGPMGGFDAAKVDAAFFGEDTHRQWKSTFLVNLGYGDPAKIFPRGERLEFHEACRIE